MFSSMNTYSCIFYITEEWQLRNAILETYEDAVKTIPFNPLVGNMGLPVDQLCIEVEMIEDAKSQKHNPKAVHDAKNKPIKSYSDLLYRDEKPAKRIFVRGKAGYGKTCYALRLVNSWKNAWMPRKEQEEEENRISKTSNMFETNCDNLMLEYDFLFYVAFRFLEREHKSVVDIVCKDYFLSDTDHSEQIKSNMEKVLRSSHYKCLVILDGLDESKLAALPVRGQLQNCQFLYTSRPSKLDVMSPKYGKDDKVVEILGLGNDLSELVENILGQYYKVNETEKQEKCMLVMSKLRSISTQQKFLYRTPILFRIPILAPYLIVQIYEDEEGLTTHSLTTTYLGIFQMLITKAMNFDRLPHTMLENFKEKKCCSKHFKSEFTFPMSKLGELAYKDLVNSASLVFKDRELKETLDDDVIDFAINSGFISQSNVIGKTTGEKSANFLHKSMQEFLAAFYLTCDDEAFEKFLREHLCTIENYINLSEVCAFLSGLNPALGSNLSERVVELANTDERLCNRRKDLLIDDNTYVDMNVLRRFTYTQCQCRREFNTTRSEDKFHMTDLTISKNIQEFMGYLRDSRTVCHESISIMYNKPGHQWYGYLRDKNKDEGCTCTRSESDVNEILKNSHSLRTLVMSESSFTTSCSMHPRPIASKFIAWPSTLFVLSISDVTFQQDTYRALNNFLTNNNELKVLQLYNVSMENDHGKGFCIAGCKNLQQLTLGKNFSFSRGASDSYMDSSWESCTYRAINKLLTEDNALEVVRLNEVRTNDSGKGGICVSGCRNLKELSFRNLDVSYIDISECCKISTITLENLRWLNSFPPKYVEIKFPKRTIESQTTQPGPVDNEENPAAELQLPYISKQGYTDQENTPVEKMSLQHSSSQQSGLRVTSPYLYMSVSQSKSRELERNGNTRHGVISLPPKNQLRVLNIYNARIQKINVSSFEYLQELTLCGIVKPGKVVSDNDIFCRASLDHDFEYIIDLSRNKKLTKVELGNDTEIDRIGLWKETPELPIQVNLPYNSQIKEFVMRNVRMKKLDLTSVTQLCTLTLKDVSISEVDLPHSKDFTQLCMQNSFTRHIDLANAVMLRDVSLNFMSSTKETGRSEPESYLNEMQALQGEINLQKNVHIHNLEIENAFLQTLDLSPANKLKTLTLRRVLLSQLDLSNNTEITTLHVSDSCIQHINLAHAVMLRYVILDLVSSVKESKSNKITFPHSLHLHDVIIKGALMQKLDLSSVTKLNRLILHGVTVSEIDVSENKELSSLKAKSSSIRHINLANATMLRSMTLILNQKNLYRGFSGLVDYDDTNRKKPRPVEICFLQNNWKESAEEENSLLSKAMQSQSTPQRLDEFCAVMVISLPYQNHVQTLTIENAVFQNMNLKLFPHLENLELNRVICTEMVLSHHENMTALNLSDASMQKTYLENNKKLKKVSLTFFNRAKEQISKRMGPPFSVELHLRHSPQIEDLTIGNAKLETLNLSAVTNLSRLTLKNVSVSTIDFQHNTKLSMVHVLDSYMQNVNIANAVRLCDLKLQVDPSTGKMNYDLTSQDKKNRMFGHTIDPSLHELPNEKISEMNLSKNKNLYILHVGDSSKQIMNIENAAMLHNVDLSFQPFDYWRMHQEMDKVRSFAVAICLPHTLHIKKLTIKGAECQQFDLSPLTNLRKLRLVDVTLTELDLKNNVELTQFEATNCRISQIDISKSANLQELALSFASSNAKRGKQRWTSNDDTIDLGNLWLVDIKLPHNSHLQTLCIQNAHLQELDLSIVPTLHQLKLDGVSLHEIHLPRNSELTKLALCRSCIKHVDFTYGVKLHDLSLNNVFATPHSQINPKGRFKVGTLPMGIRLPHSPYLEELTIRKACIQTLDLSQVKNLRKLDLQYVRIPILNLPQNAKLTELHVLESCIPCLNLENGLMLRVVNLHFVLSKTETKYTEDSEDGEEENKLPMTESEYTEDSEDGEEENKLSVTETEYTEDSEDGEEENKLPMTESEYTEDSEDGEEENKLQMTESEYTEDSEDGEEENKLPMTESEYTEDSEDGEEENKLQMTESEYTEDSEDGEEENKLPMTESEYTEDSEDGEEENKLPMTESEYTEDSEDGEEENKLPMTESEYTEDSEDGEEENKLPVKIKLPLSSHLQCLSIGNACLKTLDLSPVNNMCKLIIHGVTFSKIDLSHNTELSELTVFHSALGMLDDFVMDYLFCGQQVALEPSEMMELDLSHNTKLERIYLNGITLISSPDVRQARTVKLQDVQMDLDHWRDFADTLLSLRRECEVFLKNINDNNIVVDILKDAGFSTDNPDEFWVYPH